VKRIRPLQLIATDDGAAGPSDTTIFAALQDGKPIGLFGAARCGMYYLLAAGWTCEGHIRKMPEPRAVHAPEFNGCNTPEAVLHHIQTHIEDLAEASLPGSHVVDPSDLQRLAQDMRLVARALADKE